MKCGCNPVRSQSSEVVPNYYALDPFPVGGAPASLPELKAWLDKHAPSGHWVGKMYVATTISWDENHGVFRQKGCSPNYKAGWWTLACCKHDMRRSAKLKHMLERNDPSIFIFTLAGKSTVRDSDAQPLVSVARITKHFPTMAVYAKFILGSGHHGLISSRLSRERVDDGRYGWRFGDCHADKFGNVGRPRKGHEHHGWQWKEDNHGDHEILASGKFLVWKHPYFASLEMIKQARYGRNVTELGKVLKVIRG